MKVFSWRFRPLPTLIAAAVACAGMGPAGADAQQLPQRSDTLRLPDAMRDRGATPPRTSVGAPRTLLEGPVSRTEYLLGAGDVLTLSLVGYRSHLFTVEVAPEGTIVIPEVGVVQVGGLNLEQAEQAARRRVRSFYSDVEVSLTLSGLRSFKIFLVGNVPEPGAKEATAVTRMSEVVQPVDEEGVIHRNVTLRRPGGSATAVDLASFLRTGDLTQNPMLRAGDVIHVPPIDRTVSITGQVAFPGTYEYRQGETIGELLTLANGGGPFPADAADTIRLLRFDDTSGSEVRLIARNAATGPLGATIQLQPFDALFIPRIAHFKERTTATVGGEVGRPGTYPIEQGVTTVGDLVEMAGGLTSRASLFDALLRRRPASLPGSADEQLEMIPPELLSRDELRVLQVTNRADQGSVVLDLRDLLASAGSAYDVALRDGDRLFVPEQRHEVVVMGAVMQPGIVEYETGQSIDYFVEMAGGYTRRADRRDVSVLRGRQGNRLDRDDVTSLAPGDRIVVPFREPRTLLERVQTVEGVVSTISGFVLAIVALERIWN